MSSKLSSFRTPIAYNKGKPITECLRYFWLQKYRHYMSFEKVFFKKFNDTFFFLICKYKILKYIESEVTGFQSKAYQAVSRMSLAI